MSVGCYVKINKILGKKISNPTIAAPTAVNNTAAAAASLALPAKTWYSGETKSVRYSKPVFIASAANTELIAKIHKHHSVTEIEK